MGGRKDGFCGLVAFLLDSGWGFVLHGIADFVAYHENIAMEHSIL
jgi:hypothetical protein